MSDLSALEGADRQWLDVHENMRRSPCAETYAAALAVTTAQYLQGLIDRDTHRDDVASLNRMYEKDLT